MMAATPTDTYKENKNFESNQRNHLVPSKVKQNAKKYRSYHKSTNKSNFHDGRMSQSVLNITKNDKPRHRAAPNRHNEQIAKMELRYSNNSHNQSTDENNYNDDRMHQSASNITHDKARNRNIPSNRCIDEFLNENNHQHHHQFSNEDKYLNYRLYQSASGITSDFNRCINEMNGSTHQHDQHTQVIFHQPNEENNGEAYSSRNANSAMIKQSHSESKILRRNQCCNSRKSSFYNLPNKRLVIDGNHMALPVSLKTPGRKNITQRSTDHQCAHRRVNGMSNERRNPSTKCSQLSKHADRVSGLSRGKSNNTLESQQSSFFGKLGLSLPKIMKQRKSNKVPSHEHISQIVQQNCDDIDGIHLLMQNICIDELVPGKISPDLESRILRKLKNNAIEKAKNGKWDDSYQVLRKVIKFQQVSSSTYIVDLANSRYHLGVALKWLNRNKEAMTQFKEVVRLLYETKDNVDVAAAYFHMSLISGETGNYTQAIFYLELSQKVEVEIFGHVLNETSLLLWEFECKLEASK